MKLGQEEDKRGGRALSPALSEGEGEGGVRTRGIASERRRGR